MPVRLRRPVCFRPWRRATWPRSSAEVERRGDLELEQLPQLAQVVGERHAGGDDVWRAEERAQNAGAIHTLQRKQVHRAPGRHLREAGQVALAFPEGRARLGVEADHRFPQDVGGGALERLRRLEQVHLALVAADRQRVHLLARDLAQVLGRQGHTGRSVSLRGQA